MMRIVVPTVYYQDPLDQMFCSPWTYHYRRPFTCRPTPRCARRHQGSSLMAYPGLAAFVEAMEAMEKSEQDSGDKCARCSCKKTTNQTTDVKDPNQHDQDKPNSEESTTPSSNETVNSEQNNTPSTSAEDSSEAQKSASVTVPVKRLGDLSNSDHFQVSLNLKSFRPDDIEVTRVDNELKVHAKEQVERYGMIFHREIHRSFHLPEDIDVETLKSNLSTAGVLTIEAKRKPQTTEDKKQDSKKTTNDADAEDPSEDSTTDEEKSEEEASEHPTESSSFSDIKTTQESDTEEEPIAEEDKEEEPTTGGQEE